MQIKVSAKWLNKILLCNAAGIKLCKGKCCNTKGFYPPKSNPNGTGICPHLTASGCKFTQAQKPLKCLLYPLVITKKGTLVLHGRALTSICKACYKQGNQTIAQHLQQNLTEVFGAQITAQMLASVAQGKDFVFTPSPQVVSQLIIEEQMEKANEVPTERI